jgi:hypothetical protein
MAAARFYIRAIVGAVVFAVKKILSKRLERRAETPKLNLEQKPEGK